MNGPMKLTLIVALAVVFGGSEASTAGTGAYVGGSLGGTTFQHEASNFDDGSLASSGRVDSDDGGWKLFGGYKFNKHLAVEVGYARLKYLYDDQTTFFDGTSDGTGTFAAGPVEVDIDNPQAIFAVAMGIVPVGNNLALCGKLGAQIWEADVTTFETTGIFEKDESGIDPMVGLGLEYKVTKRWALRAEYERFMNIVDDDIDLASLSVAYGLGNR